MKKPNPIAGLASRILLYFQYFSSTRKMAEKSKSYPNVFAGEEEVTIRSSSTTDTLPIVDEELPLVEVADEDLPLPSLDEDAPPRDDTVPWCPCPSPGELRRSARKKARPVATNNVTTATVRRARKRTGSRRVRNAMTRRRPLRSRSSRAAAKRRSSPKRRRRQQQHGPNPDIHMMSPGPSSSPQSNAPPSTPRRKPTTSALRRRAMKTTTGHIQLPQSFLVTITPFKGG